MSELNPMLSVISVLTQCPVYSTGLSSYLVYRMNDNSGQIGFFYYVGEIRLSGCHSTRMNSRILNES